MRKRQPLVVDGVSSEPRDAYRRARYCYLVATLSSPADRIEWAWPAPSVPGHRLPVEQGPELLERVAAEYRDRGLPLPTVPGDHAPFLLPGERR